MSIASSGYKDAVANRTLRLGGSQGYLEKRPETCVLDTVN